MTNTFDTNALLLQVMAHDLLAPLTAIRWQVELLEKTETADEKHAQYLKGINESSQLGITLTKHAHVAGKVLVGSYKKNLEHTSLPAVIRSAMDDLHLQYERHGISLEVEVDDEKSERDVDKALVGLYMWSLAKFFLSLTPANATVSIRGLSLSDAQGNDTYIIIGSVPGVPEQDECIKTFSAQEARGSYDQTFVFAKLMREVAPLIGVSASASTQANLLAVEASFVSV